MSKKYINIDYIKPNKICYDCDYDNNYVCFNCENEQVKKLYPQTKYFSSFYNYERYLKIKNNE